MPVPTQIRQKLNELFDVIWDLIKAGTPQPNCTAYWTGTIGGVFFKIRCVLSGDEQTITIQLVRKDGAATWR